MITITVIGVIRVIKYISLFTREPKVNKDEMKVHFLNISTIIEPISSTDLSNTHQSNFYSKKVHEKVSHVLNKERNCE